MPMAKGPPPQEARRGASAATWLQLLAAAAAGAVLCSGAVFAQAGRRPPPALARLELEGSVFVGHLAADLDSVAAAVASAELYGGTAAVASSLNRSVRQQWCAAPHREPAV